MTKRVSQTDHRPIEDESAWASWRRALVRVLLTGVALSLLLAGLLLAVGAWYRYTAEPYTPTGRYIGCWPGQEVEDQGNRLRAAVDAYRAEHGKYPQTLAEAGVLPADMATEFGDWNLLLGPDGTDYELSVGNYGDNGFVLFWIQSRHEWWTDT